MIPGVTCDAKLKPGVRKDNGVHGSETENDKNDHGKETHAYFCLLNSWL